ncbi:hypothetical protein ACLK2B_15550 [Escherichia coli]
MNGRLEAARAETGKPTLICCRTIIGYGSPNKSGSHDCHGSPLGNDQIAGRSCLPEVGPRTVRYSVRHRRRVERVRRRVPSWKPTGLPSLPPMKPLTRRWLPNSSVAPQASCRPTGPLNLPKNHRDPASQPGRRLRPVKRPRTLWKPSASCCPSLWVVPLTWPRPT